MNYHNTNKFVAVFVCVLTIFAGLLAGCEVQTWMGYNQTGTGGTQDSGSGGTEDSGSGGTEDGSSEGTGGGVSFELPAEWEWSPDYPTKARLNKPPKDSIAPYVVLELIPWQQGSDEDAKAMAKEHLTTQEMWNEENPPTYKEVKLDGRNVYIIEGRTDAYWGDFLWSTTLFFEKHGYVNSIQVADRYENQQSAIQTAIETLKSN